MKCFYYIKLPKGGELKIPANFTKLSLNDKTLVSYTESFLQYKLEEKEESMADMKKLIRAYANIGLHHSTVDSLLDKSSTVEDFVNQINARIDQDLKVATLNDAIFMLLKNRDVKIEKIKKGVSSKIDLAQFLEEISKKITPKYFKDLNINTIINMSSVNSKMDEVYSNIDKYERLGIGNEHMQSLYNVLSLAFPNEKGNRATKVFFNAAFEGGTNSAVVVKNESKLPTIFYNDSNELSLFLGVFSYYASMLDVESLYPILAEYNKGLTGEQNIIDLETLDVDKFFIGSIDDEKGFTDPGFLQLLKYKHKSKLTIDAIINLVSIKLMENSGAKPENFERTRRGIIKDMQDLFGAISPNKYGHGIFDSTNAAVAQFKRDNLTNIETYHRDKRMAVKDFIASTSIDYYFSPPTKKIFNSPEDIQAFGTTIVPYKTVITLPFGENARHYIMVTGVKRVNTGIEIEGFYSLPRGALKEITPQTIRSSDQFYVRILESTKEVLEDDSKDEATPIDRLGPVVQISDPDGLPPSIIRTLLTKGSSIQYKYYSGEEKVEKYSKNNVVNKVYPNRITFNKLTPSFKPNPIKLTEKIISFTTPLSFIEGINKFINLTQDERIQFLSLKQSLSKDKTTDYLPIMPGDIIKINGNIHNEVIAVDKDDIYILIRTQDKNKTKSDFIYKVQKINRNEIETVYTNELEDGEKFALKQVVREYERIFLEEKSVREATYSYFLSPEEAKEGDYVVTKTAEGLTNTYKIINKENNYGIRIVVKQGSLEPDFAYGKIDFSKAILFITDRDISHEQSRTIADINNFRVITAESAEDIDKYPLEKRLGYSLMEIKYALPRRFNGEMQLMPSGNFTVGAIRWGDKHPIGDDFYDGSKWLIAQINKEGKNKSKGNRLFVFTKGTTGNDNIMRYDQNLQEFIILNEKGETASNYNKFKAGIKRTNSFISFSRKLENGTFAFSHKLFKVINIAETSKGPEVIVEYSGINSKGNYITIKKKINIDEAFANKEIKAVYVYKQSETLRRLEDSLDKPIPKKNVDEKEELIVNVAEKMKNLFNIPTIIVDIAPTKENGLNKKKAWIDQGEDGKPVITINKHSINKNSSYPANEEDVVHEFAHIFFTALRFSKNKQLYETIINSFKEELIKNPRLDKNKKPIIISPNESPFVIEEILVTEIGTKFIENGYIDNLKDLKTSIFKGLVESIVTLSPELNMTDFNTLNITNLESLLGQKMSNIITLKRGVTDEMKNSDMVYFDANFRDFLEKSIADKTIKIECK